VIRATVTKYCADHLISFDDSVVLVIEGDGATDPNSLDCTTGSAECAAGACLTVTVKYPFRFLVFSNLISLLGGDIAEVLDLRATTVMRLE
jgi:hypothetical protein